MANIVVTIVDANVIKVDFGAYYPTYHDVSIAYYSRNDIEKVELYSDRVKVHVLDGRSDLELSYTATTGAFIVDSVAGVGSITTNDDLASKIAALIVA